MSALLDGEQTGEREAAVEQAIAACLQTLLDRQSDDGCWTEWKLPPGESRPWTTAYIGYRLRGLPPCLGEKVKAARCAAASWLLRAEFPGGGWGYNNAVEADADSTAFGILFLASTGHP